MSLTFSEIHPDQIPKNLLLLADPSWEKVLEYLPLSSCIAAIENQSIAGAVVIHPISDSLAEIVNIAVYQNYQGKGIGTRLLQQAITHAKSNSFLELRIATANSSITQLALYQKTGFDLIEVDFHYFIREYTDPIMENGIRCRHKLILSMKV